ncbi:MAG: flagellin [bacterium]|nr:flagellin [bacterium]
MAISDVSLTAGMRGNLVSLQGTVDLLNRTQERLSSGKKVNSALDNPISYFTAEAHMGRANDISALKDAMGEAVQTIKAADNGISAITDLIDSAKALAKSALGASKNQVKVTIGSVSAGATVTIGGTGYGAVASTATASATQFNISDDAATTASNMAALINGATESTDISASVSGTTLILEAKSSTVAITQASQAMTTGSNGFTVQTDTNNKEVFSERAALAEQYNTIVSQLDSLANSSGYKGTNLLQDENLNVTFEGTSLTVKGFSASAADLNMSTQASTVGGADASFGWTLNSDIQSDVGKLDNAISTLRSEASKLSSNLSIINVQQEFSTNLVNTLTEGADKLTLADMNEEGANMLMLQTRQALGSTALSLSAQAAQSVLRLF